MKLIDKDTLLVEIDKRKIGYNTDGKHTVEYNTVKKILDILDTLEVKEVDYTPMDNDFERDAVNFCFDNGLNTTPRIAKTIAKHFFELGLSASNPITATDRGTAEEIIINLKRVEQDYRINLTKEIEWVRNKAQKGE